MARRIDPSDDRAVYKQLADILREQIETGELGPGARLPSEQHLGQAYHLSRDSVRDALQILRGEGLIVTVSGVGSRVRDEPVRTVMPLASGDRVWARMPTAAERRRLGLAEGIPVLVVERGGHEELQPADLTELAVD